MDLFVGYSQTPGTEAEGHTVAKDSHPNCIGALDRKHIYNQTLICIYWENIWERCIGAGFPSSRWLVPACHHGCPGGGHQVLVSLLVPTWRKRLRVDSWTSFSPSILSFRYSDRYMVWKYHSHLRNTNALERLHSQDIPGKSTIILESVSQVLNAMWTILCKPVIKLKFLLCNQRRLSKNALILYCILTTQFVYMSV